MQAHFLKSELKNSLNSLLSRNSHQNTVSALFEMPYRRGYGSAYRYFLAVDHLELGSDESVSV